MPLLDQRIALHLFVAPEPPAERKGDAQARDARRATAARGRRRSWKVHQPRRTSPSPKCASAAAVPPVTRTHLDRRPSSSHIAFMALSLKKATTIALDPEDDRLLTRAARERGVSRAEFIRQHLALVLEQYRRHPKPRSAGIVQALTERGDERELFSADR